jgi:hypothetical protein
MLIYDERHTLAISERFLVYRKNGTSLYVNAIRSRIDTSTLDGRSSIEGLTTLRLDDGSPVNVIDENTFMIVVTGEQVTRTK